VSYGHISSLIYRIIFSIIISIIYSNDVDMICLNDRICVVTLAEWHPILAEGKTVIGVDYQFDNVNRLCNRVTGKGKRVYLTFLFVYVVYVLLCCKLLVLCDHGFYVVYI